MDRQLSTQSKQQLCDAFLRIESIRDVNTRELYIGELEGQLQQPLGHKRHNEARHDVYSLINACLAHPGSLRMFAGIVRSFHRSSRAVDDLEQLLGVLEHPVLLVEERAALTSLAGAVSGGVWEGAWHAVPDLTDRPTPAWTDLRGVVESVQTISGLLGEPLIVVRFVAQLARRSSASTASALLRWSEQLAGRIGLNQDLVRLEYGIIQDENGPNKALGVDNGAEAATESGHPTAAPPESPGADVQGATVMGHHPSVTQHPMDSSRILGGIPLRNPHFTGREAMLAELRSALARHAKASVLPQTLQGYGGVGKTQLAIEFVYRNADEYHLVWWINAERESEVLSSLASLGQRLGLPEVDDLRQRARTVIDALNTSTFRWLLVYDNADQPVEITPLVPTVGGHVILTSRNPVWTTLWDSIRVDVFARGESLELLGKRATSLTGAVAEELAEKLGDLPLALEQAVNFQQATTMSAEEYLLALDNQVRDLLEEGQPAGYHTTVTAILTLAFQSLRADSPAAAELLELFAHLGPEPISNTLLRNGRAAELSENLAAALRNPVQMGRMIRDLDRFGVARVDPQGKSIQVHRLVRAVLRETLTPQQLDQSLTTAQNLLGAASPSDPDDRETWRMHAEIGPHILPADLIGSTNDEARLVALDQARYLFLSGDYRGSRVLGKAMVDLWNQEPEQGGLGPDHEHTLVAFRHLANAQRMLGDYTEAKRLDEVAFQRLRARADFGDDHEHTVGVALGLGFDLSMAGDLEAALLSDQENLDRATRVHGPTHNYTLRAKVNVATQLRQLGRTVEAHELSATLVEENRKIYGLLNENTLYATGELARDLLGLGRYGEALDVLVPVRDGWNRLGPRATSDRLNVDRIWAVLLRKTGDYPRAVTEARNTYHSLDLHLGSEHEHTLAARMTFANCLRAAGTLRQARSEGHAALAGYRAKLGRHHRFTLAAQANLAIILRRIGEHRTVYDLEREAYETLHDVLGAGHPYTLCAATNYAQSLIWARQVDQARTLMRTSLTLFERAFGPRHPDTLACELNIALDEHESASTESESRRYLDQVLDTLAEVLGREHPETLDGIRGKRADCDIEPPAI